jgi:hypothetical protein
MVTKRMDKVNDAIANDFNGFTACNGVADDN